MHGVDSSVTGPLEAAALVFSGLHSVEECVVRDQVRRGGMLPRGGKQILVNTDAAALTSGTVSVMMLVMKIMVIKTDN